MKQNDVAVLALEEEEADVLDPILPQGSYPLTGFGYSPRFLYPIYQVSEVCE